MLLILAGVTISTFTGQGSIIDNAKDAVGKYNNSVIKEQEMLNEIREYIKNDGNVEEANGITISVVPDTTGVAKNVTVTIAAISEEGIKSLTSNTGINKTYEEGTKEILETCEITENGIYTFTVENEKGQKASKGILIGNILEGTIGITADKTMPTKDNVKVTIIWPDGSENGIKEIKIGNGTWQSVSGSTSEVEVEQNCTVEARVRNGEEDVIASSITISNIDKNNPTVVTVTSGTETITEGTSIDISSYFTYSENGTAEITSIKYTDTSNGDVVVTNTNTLSIGTHIIKCTVTKATGLSATATKTIIVETAIPVNSDGLAIENTTIKPDPNSNVQITIPAGFAPAILATGTTQSGPGQDGSVKSIMPADQWNNITVEDINKGIVIVDNLITYDNGQQTGTTPDFNEYVWVSTPNFDEDFKRTAWTKGTSSTPPKLADKSTLNAYWEDTTAQEYQDMLASVQHYKGFYIGRYEASRGANGTAQSKRNRTPWTRVSQTETITACTENTTENMHLMYGVEWDSVLNWLKDNATISSPNTGETKTMDMADIQNDSSSWGNYINSIGDAASEPWVQYKLQNTGASEYWKANNIYDLAGNVYEWTQEKYSTGTGRAIRGGTYGDFGSYSPAAYRSNVNESNTSNNVRVQRQLFCSTGRW